MVVQIDGVFFCTKRYKYEHANVEYVLLITVAGIKCRNDKMTTKPNKIKNFQIPMLESDMEELKVRTGQKEGKEALAFAVRKILEAKQ